MKPYHHVSRNLSQSSYSYIKKKCMKHYCKINLPKRQRPEITYELCKRNILLPVLEVYSVTMLSPHLTHNCSGLPSLTALYVPEVWKLQPSPCNAM